MFHHFHNNFYPKSQGSIDEKQFEKILDFLEKNFNLLGADKFSDKVLCNKLESNDIVLSFDDALKCQFDIALPKLEERNISCFFFIYSSPFKNELNMLEVYRYFRNTCYNNINDFYDDFFKIVKNYNVKEYDIVYEKFNQKNYLENYKFYTYEDRWFRFLRDRYLNNNLYSEFMIKLMKEKKFKKENSFSKLWMNENNIKSLESRGHVIGLHSYYHPTLIENKSYEEQKNEYTKNLRHLEGVIGKNKIFSMAHPCGNYNTETLNILKDLNIKIGFKSNMVREKKLSTLEIPRQDHINIINQIYSNH
ncbi:MAG: hypothetical protein CBE11_03825 [Rickettsiales bacterium TMED251]|nr:MAG: hypothetical protein CBE11_03825 [Rickettsiales bacterium TMED251]